LTYQNEVDLAWFCQASNGSDKAGKSLAERAALYAGAWTPEMLDALEVPDSIDTLEKLLRYNSSLVTKWLKGLPLSDMNELKGESGQLNNLLVSMAEATFLHKALSLSPDVSSFINRTVSLDNEVGGINEGIALAAPALAKAENLIVSGRLDDSYSIAKDLIAIVDKIQNSRAGGITNETLLTQRSISPELTNQQLEMLPNFFEQNSLKVWRVKGAKDIAAMLTKWANLVISCDQTTEYAVFKPLTREACLAKCFKGDFGVLPAKRELNVVTRRKIVLSTPQPKAETVSNEAVDMVIMADKVMVTVKGEGELFQARVKVLRNRGKMVAGKVLSLESGTFVMPAKVSLTNCSIIAEAIAKAVTPDEYNRQKLMGLVKPVNFIGRAA